MEDLNEKVFIERLIEATRSGKLKWNLSSRTFISFETELNGFVVCVEECPSPGRVFYYAILEERNRITVISGNSDLMEELFNLVYEPWRESQRQKDATTKVDLLSRASRFLENLG